MDLFSVLLLPGVCRLRMKLACTSTKQSEWFCICLPSLPKYTQYTHLHYELTSCTLSICKGVAELQEWRKSIGNHNAPYIFFLHLNNLTKEKSNGFSEFG
ncbi:F-box/WD repeat-containing protein 7 [Platysternon megacephalum]|uniref:F-box/WD repeat-containing protein 7 n=1 Tax=Platysternon megacephalum TaxID=55544 RepID=A0A4D9E9N4_9SAUR|nr:F-box/WD repeat-containing protein 7 [Platysternon megacephalum]